MKLKKVAYIAASTLRYDIESTERTNPKWCGWFLGGLKIAVQVLVLAIVGGLWILLINKEYKVPHTGLSGTTNDVMGVGVATMAVSEEEIPFDARDVLIPDEENDAFFVATNPVITNGQQRGECAENSVLDSASCSDDTNCTRGRIYVGGHGVSTGICNQTAGACIIKAWCPLPETDVSSNNVLLDVANFTVLIKNYAYFPEFNITLSNIRNTENQTFLDRCEFDTVKYPLCPVFKLGYMIQAALQKKGIKDLKESYKQIALRGGVFAIRISWLCDFDQPPDGCIPKYNFDRLDAGERNTISQGYYIKHTKFYADSNGTETRQLITSYGVKFLISVDAKGTKSDFITGFLAFGSALAYASPVIGAIAIFGGFCQKKEKKDKKLDEGIEMQPMTQLDADNS